MCPQKFYIVGSQRSGTTLLRLILNSHSRVTCHDEARAYEVLSDSQKLESLLREDKETQWIGFKIPRLTEQLNNPSLFDYGLSQTFRNFYRRDPLVFIVRDVRDVVCSMRTLYFGGVSWLQKWGIPIIQFWIEKSAGFRQEYEREIRLASGAANYELAMGALYWKFKSKCYFKYRELEFPVIQFRYEDVIRDPRGSVSRLISHLGLGWEDSLLQHHRMEHSEVDGEGLAIGGTDSRMPISGFHVERYKSELTTSQVDEILSISGDLMESFDYSM